MKKLDVEKVKAELQGLNEGTKVYIGCDSIKYKKNKVKGKGGDWYAKYTTVLVIHKNGKNGCSVYGRIEDERDFDQNKKRPSMRLMNEVYKVSGLYAEFAEIFEEFDIEVEVHLDISEDKMYGSSCVVDQAIGYVKGMCNVDAKIKPFAWAASYAADRFTYYGKDNGSREIVQ
jgi:predicted RNase H-related nuclease YkuK (DUF458 family)